MEGITIHRGEVRDKDGVRDICWREGEGETAARVMLAFAAVRKHVFDLGLNMWNVGAKRG